jgi:hypothetical protein
VTSIRGDASDLYRVAADLSEVGAKAIGPMREVMLAAGEVFKTTWQANARATSGAHGVHYPDSIEAKMAFGVSTIAVDVGPNAGMPQGGMSFEHGSRNQPPHLDGLKAMDAVSPQVEALFTAATASLF